MAVSTKRTYTAEFLQSLKLANYDCPVPVQQFNDKFMMAPNPAHRPNVGKRERKGNQKAGSAAALSSRERKELQQKRQQPLFVEAAKAVPSPPPRAKNPNDSDDEDDDIKPGELEMQRALQAARKQETSLVSTAPPVTSAEGTSADGAGTVNQLEPKSLLARKRPVTSIETDEHKISQREKQIQKGKATIGYQNYIRLRPAASRTKEEPHTPNTQQKCSKRSWEGQFRIWRQHLHLYDDPETAPKETCTKAERARLAAMREERRKAQDDAANQKLADAAEAAV